MPRKMRRSVPGLVVASLYAALGASPAQAVATDVRGTWEVSIDCSIYATATSFVGIDEDLATGTISMTTPPFDCGTVEAPGGIYPVASCASTPDPRDGVVSGTTLDSPTTVFYTSDAGVATAFEFSFTSCAVARIISQHRYAGTITSNGAGRGIRIAGTLQNGSLEFRTAADATCFSLPDAPDCQFEMLRNDVEPGSDVTVSPHAGVTVTFDTVTAPGAAIVMPVTTPTGTVPSDFQVYTAPGAFGGPAVPIFYDVHTTAAISGPITSCFTYPDANGDGFVDGTTPPLAVEHLRVFHAEDGTYVDRTLSLDTTAQVVCARTLSLSQIVLGTTASSTTTLPGGCAVEASFDSILCRLDALVAEVDAENDLGRLKQNKNILNSVKKALKQTTKASTGSGKVGRTQLKKCAKSLDVFGHKLDSLNARHLVPKVSRDALRGEAGAIRTDVVTLRGTL